MTNARRAALTINAEAAWQAEDARREWWERKKAEKVASLPPEGGLVVWSFAELDDMPDDAPPWVWAHDRCCLATQTYEISGERIATPLAALGWTLHLAGKEWFNCARWEAAMRRFFVINA